MKYLNNEIFFKSRHEAIQCLDLCRDNGLIIYECARCGIAFASADPYTSYAGIICSVCVKADNLSPNDNYRPDYFAENHEIYDDNLLYDPLDRDDMEGY